MWVRQCDLDAQVEAPSPIPTRIASNEEFIPPVQSPQQHEFEARLTTISEGAARRQGMSRRDFLRSGSGMAAALVALNQVFGPCYDVDAAEVEDKNPLPPDQMVATRQYVNDLAGSQRVLSHGLLRPNLGPKELEEMERQVKELKIDAWKMYTGAELGEQAWFMDDEKVAYPFWEKTKKLGVKNLCVHKGLPLGFFNEKACTPLDLEKAAKDWPDLNFIVYHSGFRGFGSLAGGTGAKVKDPKSDDRQEIPWSSDI